MKVRSYIILMSGLQLCLFGSLILQIFWLDATTVNSVVITISTFVAMLAIYFAASQYTETNLKNTYDGFRRNIAELSNGLADYYLKINSNITVSDISESCIREIQTVIRDNQICGGVTNMPLLVSAAAVTGIENSKKKEQINNVMADIAHAVSLLHQLPILKRILWECFDSIILTRYPEDLKLAVRTTTQRLSEQCNMANSTLLRYGKVRLCDAVTDVLRKPCYCKFYRAVATLEKSVISQSATQLEAMAAAQRLYAAHTVADSHSEEFIRQAVKGLPDEDTLVSCFRELLSPPAQTQETLSAEV